MPRRSPSLSGWAPDRRFLALAIILEAIAVVLAYIAHTVPLAGPRLTRGEAHEHWQIALAGALLVAAGMLYVILDVRKRNKLHAAAAAPPSEEAADPVPLPLFPRALLFERTPRRTVLWACAISLLVVPAAFAVQAPLWLAWVAMLAPWVGLVALEARAKYARYGVFSLFALLGLLQLLHMVEHTTQVGQLVATSGDLSLSHGIVGQLDFELVHFVFDTMLWIGLGLLLTINRNRNVWLWVAFVAASLHEIEHLYLFWLHLFDNNMYLAGGFNGIMGHRGMIGSPLDRPYMHYTYNLIVFVPMLLAIWDEARRMDRLHPAQPTG